MNTRSDNIEWPFKESPIPELVGSKPPTNKTVLLHFMHFHDGTGGSAKKRDAATTTASNVQSWWKKYISEANLMLNTWIVKSLSISPLLVKNTLVQFFALSPASKNLSPRKLITG